MHGVKLVTRPAPNSVAAAISGWWLSASPRPDVSMLQCSTPHGHPDRAAYTLHPERYSERTYSAGILVFAISPVRESISSTWAVRTARLASNTLSGGGPAWPGKFEPAGVPPLHAAIHSA